MAKTQPANNSANRRSPQAQSTASKAKKSPVKKPRVGVTKIDWDYAFQWYCADTSRTMVDVAKEFGVAHRNVQRHSASEVTPWPERRLAVVESIAKRAAKRRYRDVVDRDDVHLKAFRSAITAHTNTIIREGSKEKDADNKALVGSTNALYKAVMGERIILGLPVLIARSEITSDDDELETPAEVSVTAAILAEHLQRLEKYRNNG